MVKRSTLQEKVLKPKVTCALTRKTPDKVNAYKSVGIVLVTNLGAPRESIHEVHEKLTNFSKISKETT